MCPFIEILTGLLTLTQVALSFPIRKLEKGNEELAMHSIRVAKNSSFLTMYFFYHRKAEYLYDLLGSIHAFWQHKFFCHAHMCQHLGLVLYINILANLAHQAQIHGQYLDRVWLKTSL